MLDLAIIAQAGIVQTVGQWAIAAILIAGICGVFLIYCQVTGFNPPQWLKNLAWLLVALVLCVMAVLFIMRYAG